MTGEQEVESREEAPQQYTIDTATARQFPDRGGKARAFRGKVCDCSDPCWRVGYTDDDRGFTRRELIHGI